MKDDDSGICSDLTTASLSSSSNTSLSNQTPRKVNNNEKKRFFNLNFKSKQMQTPVLSSEKSSSSKESKNTNISDKNSQLDENFTLGSKSRSDLFNLRNNSSFSIDFDSNLSANRAKFQFFNKFNAKNVLSLIINKNYGEDQVNSTHLTPKTLHNRKDCFSNNSNLSIDEINKELAQLLVSNAIIKAKYELNSCDEFDRLSCQDDVKKSDCDSSNGIFSPLSVDSSQSETKSETDSATFNSPWTLFENDPFSNKEFNKEIYSLFTLNMHRIDKDVLRCDRNFWYFSSGENLNKLKNVIYT